MRRRILPLLLLGLLAALGGAVWLHIFRDHAFDGRFGLEQPAAYALEARMTTTTPGASAEAEVALVLSGTLYLRPFSGPGAATPILATFSLEVLMEKGRPADEERRRHIQIPFAFDLTPRGRLEHFRFPDGLPESAAELLSGTLRQLEIVLPEPAVSPLPAVWTAGGRDAVGVYVARLSRRDGGSLLRKKLRWKVREGGAVLPVRVDAETAEAEADLAPNGEWLARLQWKEVLRIRFGDRPDSIRAESTGTLRRLPRQVISPSLMSYASIDDAMRAARVEPSAGAAAKTASEANRAAFADLLQAYPVNSQNPSDWIDALAEALRQAPALADVPAKNLGGTAASALRDGSLLVALGQSGSPEAQRALVRVMEDGAAFSGNRLQAAVALGYVNHPAPETVEALWTRFDAGAGVDPSAVRLSNAAALSVGRMAMRANRENPFRARDLATGITDRLGATQDPEKAAVLLEALSNTGLGYLEPTAAAFLQADDPLTRESAARALRRFSGAAGDAALAESLASEPDPSARDAIARTLAERPPSAAGVKAAAARLPVEPDPLVRQSLVDALGAALEAFPNAKSALTQQASAEGDPRVLERLGHYLSAGEFPRPAPSDTP